MAMLAFLIFVVVPLASGVLLGALVLYDHWIESRAARGAAAIALAALPAPAMLRAQARRSRVPAARTGT